MSGTTFEVQVEVNAECGKIEEGMKGRLGKVFSGDDQIEYLVGNTRPLEIKEEPVEDIPF
jgi:hypothetical protein